MAKHAPESVLGFDVAESDHSPALFGGDTTTGVVAVEVRNREAVLIRADGAARLRESRPFSPWLLTTAQAAPTLQSRGGVTNLVVLRGDSLSHLLEFSDWDACIRARRHAERQGLPHLVYADPGRQFQMRSGVTLFKGLAFDDLRRMQLDLETTGLDPNAPDARILLAAVTDNRGGAWVFSGEEGELLRDVTRLLREQDPDVIEGHNLLGFDMPYLAARAAARGIPLAFGRDGSDLRLGAARPMSAMSGSQTFRPARIWGRHCLDTYLALIRFDVGRGEMDSYALKAAARHFGISEPDRVELDRSRMLELWTSDPETVRRYALQDVTETRRLAEITLPTAFFQSRMAPDGYATTAVGGAGERIDALLVREYLRRGEAIPIARPPEATPGGYTELRRAGILHRVVKADVESLYPSLMLVYSIHPSTDRLGVFLPLLDELRTRRLTAKARSRSGAADAAYWDGLQNSFKILINSFYGYLGAGGPVFHFNDPEAASEVTTTGQKLIRRVAEELEATGSQVIEIDTDGIYFVPPESVPDADAEQRYVDQVGRVLPDGIHLAHDGRYAVMISLKVKNYALITYDGRRVLHGASLRSRADERFGRQFLSDAIGDLASGNTNRLAERYADLRERIAAGRVAPGDLARRERVTTAALRSRLTRLRPEERAGLRVGDQLSTYEREGGGLGLISGYAGDEDRFAYLEKLHRFAGRLEGALGNEMERVCPRPSAHEFAARRSGQQTLF